MRHWIKALDRILRGQATQLPDLQRGTFDVPIGGLSFVMMLLGIFYGACMGVSAIMSRWPTDKRYMGFEQMAASMVKVPMLYFLTLLITFPSLYVFNALIGSRLSMVSVLRLLIAAGGVMLAVLASFGPIVAFFALSTTSYPFMKLLNVIVFAIAGFLSLAFLLRTLDRLTMAQEIAEFLDHPLPPPPEPTGNVEPPPLIPPTAPPSPTPPDLSYSAVSVPIGPKAKATTPGALDRALPGATRPRVNTVFRIWVLVFGLVGAQMSWVLRPFVGDPNANFEFLRPRSSNFFEAVYHTIEKLLS
jgi:hypothetical protein